MSMRQVDTRVDVYRNGVKYSELVIITAPTIQMSYDSEIKSSMTGEFLPNDEINWLTDCLVPILIIDGIEHKMGVFYPTTIETNRTDGLTTINVEAYDGCWLATCKRASSIYHIDAGTNYIVAIETLLNAIGINMIIKSATTYTLAEDREDWEIGTDYLTIINQLLDEINFNELWFNNDGYAILEPDSILDISHVERTYDYFSSESMMLDSSSIKLDLFDSPNVFMCICANPDKTAIMTSTKVNDNPSSPFSVVNRGKEILSVTEVDNIASQDELNDYAEILCNESIFQGKEMTLTTLLRTDCGLRDVVAINHPDYAGICVESEWSLTLETGGTMTHTLQTQPIVIVKEEPSSNGAIAGIAIAGISIVGTS